MKLGRIDVVGAMVGADVFVDDERIGMAPLDHSVDVEPGPHLVRSQGRGGRAEHPGDGDCRARGDGEVRRVRRRGSGAGPATRGARRDPGRGPPCATRRDSHDLAGADTTGARGAVYAREHRAGSLVRGGDRSHHWGWVAATGVVTVAGFTTALVMCFEKTSAQNSANSVAAAIEANGGGQGTCYIGPNSPTPKFAGACNDLSTDDNNVNADATIANVGIAVGIVGGAGFIISTIFAATSYSHSDREGAAGRADVPCHRRSPLQQGLQRAGRRREFLKRPTRRDGYHAAQAPKGRLRDRRESPSPPASSRRLQVRARGRRRSNERRRIQRRRSRRRSATPVRSSPLPREAERPDP